MIRQPVVAGTFYSNDAASLKQQLIQWFSDNRPDDNKAIAAMVPHAGYVYSGEIAAQTIEKLKKADTIILLGPNHTGLGAVISVSAAKEWVTPLGNFTVDDVVRAGIVESMEEAALDNQAHRDEHSLEVLLPLLRYQHANARIVPVTIGTRSNRLLKKLGDVLADIIITHERSVAIIASSDMNHFGNLETTRKLDQMALDQVLAMNPEQLLKTVTEHQISMCGAGPAAVMLYAVNRLGKVKADLVKYGTSADAFGDTGRVVGYAGVVIEKTGD